MVGNGFAGRDAEAAPAFAFGGLEALEEVEEGEGGERLGAWWWCGKVCECWVLLVLGSLCFILIYVEVESKGMAREVRQLCVPDWTDHACFGVAAVCGTLEVASGVSLGLAGGIEVAWVGGGSGADMIG